MGQDLFYKQNPYFCSKLVKDSRVTNIKGRFPHERNVLLSKRLKACSKIPTQGSHDKDVKEVLNATSFQYTET
jgi:hypothetical protein